MCTLLWLIPRMARRSPSRIPPIHPSTFIHYLPKFLYIFFSFVINFDISPICTILLSSN
jgi:hypothetical protein